MSSNSGNKPLSQGSHTQTEDVPLEAVVIMDGKAKNGLSASDSVIDHDNKASNSHDPGREETVPEYSPEPIQAANTNATAQVTTSAQDGDTHQPTQLGLWPRIFRNLSRASPLTKAYALFTFTLNNAQVIVGIVLLSLSAHESESCDVPIRPYSILNTIYLALIYPVSFYCQFGIRDNNRNTSSETNPNSRIAPWIKRFRSLLRLCSWVLFFFGNCLVFRLANCRDEAPKLYGLGLLYIIVMDVQIFLPIVVLILFAVIFVALRLLLPAESLQFLNMKGANVGQISKLPVVRYTAGPHISITSSVSSPPSLHTDIPAAGNHNQSTTSPPPLGVSHPSGSQSAVSLPGSNHHPHGRRPHLHIANPFVRLARRLKMGRSSRSEDMQKYKAQLSGPMQDFTPRDADDHTCAICLSEYEEGDILRLLPCKHHMHQTCVDEWLQINKLCPLCKQEITTNTLAEEQPATTVTAATNDNNYAETSDEPHQPASTKTSGPSTTPAAAAAAADV